MTGGLGRWTLPPEGVCCTSRQWSGKINVPKTPPGPPSAPRRRRPGERRTPGLPARVGLLPLVASALLAGPARGQDAGFRLEGLAPAGGRTTVTEAWGTLRFTVTNADPAPHDLRVVAFYPERPEVQYARDVWVPARSRLSAWVPVGPIPASAARMR
jgi:hypothetical protein